MRRGPPWRACWTSWRAPSHHPGSPQRPDCRWFDHCEDTCCCVLNQRPVETCRYLTRLVFKFVFQPPGSPRRFGRPVSAASQNFSFLRHKRARRTDGVFVRLQGTAQQEGGVTLWTNRAFPVTFLMISLSSSSLLLCPVAQFFGLSAGPSRSLLHLSSSSRLFLHRSLDFSSSQSVPPTCLHLPPLLSACWSRAAH